MVYMVCNRNQYRVLSAMFAKSWHSIKILMLFHDFHVRSSFAKVHYFSGDYCIKTSKEKCVFMLQQVVKIYFLYEGFMIYHHLTTFPIGAL